MQYYILKKGELRGQGKEWNVLHIKCLCFSDILLVANSATVNKNAKFLYLKRKKPLGSTNMKPTCYEM